MDLIIKLFIITVPLSIIIHILVGVYLKSLLKKANKFALYKAYAKKHKEEKTFKDYCQNLVFLIPIFNMLIALVEVGNAKQCYPKLLNELKDFEKRERAAGNDDILPEQKNEESELDEIAKELKNNSNVTIGEENHQPQKLTQEELDNIAKDYHDYLKEKQQDDNSMINIQDLKEQSVKTKIG